MTTVTVPPEPPVIAPPRHPIFTVLAAALANLFAGLFLGMAVTGVLWGAGIVFQFWKWTFVIAMCAAGALGFYRFAHDEARTLYLEWKVKQQENELATMESDLKSVRNDLAAANRKIREQESILLGRPTFVANRLGDDDPVLNDARKIVSLKYGDGRNVNQRMMTSLGWTEQRYAAALTLLHSAGIVERKGNNGNVIEWAAFNSPAAALVNLEPRTSSMT
jgi:hypothetical protein